MQDKIQYISPIKQRILNYIDTLGISKREFYSKSGISRGTLESPTGITEDTVAKFIESFPAINLVWLLTGRGDELIEVESNEKLLPFSTVDKKSGESPPCESCKLKDQIIESLRMTIETQAKLITKLEKECVGSEENTGQKRKAV